MENAKWISANEAELKLALEARRIALERATSA